MHDHQAPEQMIGYLYQVRYALYLLLQSDNDSQISIEKFDDIAFEKNDTPEQLIQVKHHVKSCGLLTDASTDLWRTINVWVDAVNQNAGLVDKTKFLIITTSSAPDNSAAANLRNTNRNIDQAYEKLMLACRESKNAVHKKYYKAFSNMEEGIRKKLVKNIEVLDKTSNINEVEKYIRKEIKYNCLPKHENQICERLEGWWYKKTIEALLSENPIYFTQNQIRSYIVELGHEYSDDNLPIDVFLADDELSEKDLAPHEKLFYEQLKLISLGSNQMRTALRDYYRAFKQRNNWISNDLLHVNELDEYEQRLTDEWKHYFAITKDDLEEYGETLEEKTKVAKGKRLLAEMQDKDIRIRTNCGDAFVMRGSYHMLANQLKIGWHVDFLSRLKHLLT